MTLTDLAGKLRDTAARLGDPSRLTPLLASLEATAVSAVRENFFRERSAEGSPWAPLKHRQGPKLRKSGRLFNSLTSTATTDGILITATAPYAGVHQHGATIRRTGRKRGGYTLVIPARPFLGVNQAALARMAGAIAEHEARAAWEAFRG